MRGRFTRSVVGSGALLGSLLLQLECSGGSDAIGVQPGQLAVIVLTPATVTLLPTETQPFVASCRDNQAIVVACPDLAWTINGGTGGDTFDIHGTGVKTSVVGASASTVNVGAAGSVQNIKGTAATIRRPP